MKAPKTHELSKRLAAAKVRDKLAFSHMFDHACELEDTLQAEQEIREGGERCAMIDHNEIKRLRGLIENVEAVIGHWRLTDWFREGFHRGEITTGVNEEAARELLKKLETA